MKIKVLIGILVVLIVVNLATIGSFLFYRFGPREHGFRPPPMVEGGPEQLSREQRRELFKLLREFGDETENLREEITELEKKLFELLQQENIPEAAVDSTLREIQERRLAMSKFAIQKMGVAKTFLTPEQQKRFFSAIIQARSPRPDRFDGPFDRGRPHRDKGGFDGPPPKPNW
ncbi:MAG TPA: periplasmic heavy metal sensor [Calditrichia bacterium]|nr:periplasmic heavy metal sensor [Calditrichota bacterium]HQU71427.1 periplasmic heavy metal sensor [Calditrichia bacterium]HQV31847.1 periplasmic heavy metal sensor [Calditrichia bacterium]